MEPWEIARRNRTLIRAINVRRGMRRADEAPPADHWNIRDPELEQKALDAYYEFKGWDIQGIPTVEKGFMPLPNPAASFEVGETVMRYIYEKITIERPVYPEKKMGLIIYPITSLIHAS